MMGKIFEYFGFIFYFYSNEHEPVHVHVRKGGKESVFDLIIENGLLVAINRREKNNTVQLSYKDESIVVEFIKYYWMEIVDKWITFFVFKQSVSDTRINRKIK